MSELGHAPCHNAARTVCSPVQKRGKYQANGRVILQSSGNGGQYD